VSHHFCPDYEEALSVERGIRSKALAGTQESIAGIPVVQLTPRLWDVLTANHSPYAIGGTITVAAMAQFIWILSSESKGDNSDIQSWLESKLLTSDFVALGKGISEYLDRIFMDATEGTLGIPFYPLSIGLCHQMAKEPYHWPIEKTYDETFPKIFLLLRPVTQANGVPLINRMSDKVMLSATAELERKLKAGEITQEYIDNLNRLK